jgi:hypothetical protein
MYTVTLRNLISDQSFYTSLIVSTTTKTKATISIASPDNTEGGGVVSTPPLTGKYRVKCVNSLNEVSHTHPINVHSGWWTVAYRINYDCHEMWEKVTVREEYSTHGARGNGV